MYMEVTRMTRERCNGSGDRRGLSVGERISKMARCQCGRVLSTGEATIPQHNRPRPRRDGGSHAV